MAAEKDDKEANAEEKVPEKKKGFPLKWIIIGLVALIVLGGGASAAFFLLKPKAHDDGKKPADLTKPAIVVFYPMEPYIVNLIDNEGERYLKVVMQLELSDAPVTEELNLIKPKLRDAILELLSAKTYKEMMDPLGKQRLRDEIIMRANMYTTKGKVSKVYFTEFVIQ
jgi:flagellar FliL protein